MGSDPDIIVEHSININIHKKQEIKYKIFIK